MTELEILRRRRELVVLSAELQRATLVRRLDNVHRHPLHSALGMARKAASYGFALKLAALLATRFVHRKDPPERRRAKPSFISRWSWMLRLIPVRVFPVLKFLNR